MIKVKKIFCSFLYLSLLFALISCHKKSKAESYTKPLLEVSFSTGIEYVPLSYLTSVIGSGSGEDETFGEKKSLLLFFEEDGCATCQKVKDSVDDWVRKAGCTVYGYKEDAENSSAEERQEFLKKLGSEDGIELTAGRLIAFTEGKRRGAIAGTFDLESAQNVDIFARRYFSFPEKDSFVNSDRKLLSGLKELRALLAEKKNFILYTERRTCPFCRLLSDPQSYNSLTLLLKNSPLPLYKIISEDTLRDLYKEVSVDGKSYPSVFDYLKDSEAYQKLWPNDDIDKKKAEYIELLLALRLIPASPDDDEVFLKGLRSYAESLRADDEKKFLWSDRLVPSFSFVSKKENSPALDLPDFSEKLNKAYLAEGKKEIPHRAHFSFYFAADNELLDKESYNAFLKDWALLCNNINKN